MWKIVAANEVFAASGKRLYNRQFANKHEKNTVVTDGIHNEFFFPDLLRAALFSSVYVTDTIFRVLCNTRDMLMLQNCKNVEEWKQGIPTMFHLSVQSCDYSIHVVLELTTIFLM